MQTPFKNIEVEYKRSPNASAGSPPERKTIERQGSDGRPPYRQGSDGRPPYQNRNNGGGGRPPMRRPPQAAKPRSFIHIQNARKVNGRIGVRFLMGCRGRHVIITDAGGHVTEGVLTEFDDFSFILDVGDRGGMLVHKGAGVRVHCPDRRILRYSVDDQKVIEMTQDQVTALVKDRRPPPPEIKLDPVRARRHYQALGKEIPLDVLNTIQTLEAEAAAAKAKKEAEELAKKEEYEKRKQQQQNRR